MKSFTQYISESKKLSPQDQKRILDLAKSSVGEDGKYLDITSEFSDDEFLIDSTDSEELYLDKSTVSKIERAIRIFVSSKGYKITILSSNKTDSGLLLQPK